MSVSPHLHPGCTSCQEAAHEYHQPDGGHAGPKDHKGQLGGLDPDTNIRNYN